VRGNEFYSISQAGEGVQRESELSHGILCCATDLQGKGISSEVSFPLSGKQNRQTGKAAMPAILICRISQSGP